MKSNFSIIVALLLTACSGQPATSTPSKEDLIEINRVAAKKEAIQIQQYVDERKWPTVVTGTGLHYYVYEKGTGDSVKTNQEVKLNMTITLLNGDTCYSWKAYGPETFVVDHNHNESGLHEAVKKMRVGDKAKVILPSHLAFGVAGDFSKIPSRTSVVYDIELLSAR